MKSDSDNTPTGDASSPTSWPVDGLPGEVDLSTFLPRLPLAVIATDADGACIWANAAWSRLSGVSFEEALGTGWARALHPGDTERVTQEWAEAALAGKIYDGRYRFLRKDGTVRWVHGISARLRDTNGAVAGHIGFVIDETPAIDLAQIAWVLSDQSDKVDDGWSTSYGDLTELNTDRTLLDGIGSHLLHEIASEYIDMLGSSSAIYERNGDYALGIFSSGWCRMMDAASRALCRTDSDAEALASGRWLCHESCWTDCAKPAIERSEPVDIRCTGGINLYAVPILAGNEVVGAANIGYGSPPLDNESLEALARDYNLPVERLREVAFQHESRPPFVVELAKHGIRTSARLMGEIVKRRQAEDALNDHKAHLEEMVEERTAEARIASAAKSEFLASMSHELRTPLNSLIGFTGVLLSEAPGKINQEQRTQLEMMRNAGHHLHTLVNDVLDLAKVEAGHLGLSAQEFDWPALVQSAAESLRAEIEAAGIDYTVVSESCEFGAVVTDQTRVHQVVLNLVGNAIKFTEQGSISVVSECVKDRVSVTVTDTGRGIGPNDLEAIFEEYYQVPAESEAKPKGAGLGLPLSRALARRLGGDITVSSESGKGSSFTLSIPRTPTR